jgi:hypothetical protein
VSRRLKSGCEPKRLHLCDGTMSLSTNMEFTVETQQSRLTHARRALQLKGLTPFIDFDVDYEVNGNNVHDEAAQDSMAFDRIFHTKFVTEEEKEIYNRMVDQRNITLSLQAMNILRSYLNAEQQVIVDAAKDPHELWEKMENLFFTRGSLSACTAADKIFSKALNNFSLARKDITKYLTALFVAYGGVKSANKKNEEGRFTERRLCYIALEALDGEVHKSTVTELKVVLELSDEEAVVQTITWVRIREKLLAAQTKLKTKARDNSDSDDNGDDLEEKSANANVTKRRGAEEQRDAEQQAYERGVKVAMSTSFNKAAKYTGTCMYCHKIGHKEDQCWRKHPSLLPEWAQRGGRGGKRDE